MSADFTFLHTADVHLDSPIKGIELFEGAPVEQVRGATRRVFTALVDLAIDESVAFVLVAGDLYDGNWRDYSTGLYFVSEVGRLVEHGIGVYVISGNHDAKSQLTGSLRLPEGAHLFATSKPETVRLDALGVAIHGQGFATRSVPDNLALGYPAAVAGALNIAMLHTSLDGREGHADYAPCRVDDLRAKGYDYWALGHVHQREVVSERPWIVFPGNLQGRHARETGSKGAELVRVEDGVIVGTEHRSLDVVRWAHCNVDATDAAGFDEVLDRATGALDALRERETSELVIARLAIHGRCVANAALRGMPDAFEAECRAHLGSMRAGELWLEKIVIGTEPPLDQATLAAREDAIGGLRQAFAAAAGDDATLAALAEALADLKRKLPPLLSVAPDAGDDGRSGTSGLGGERFDVDDPALLRELLRDAAALLESRLIGGEERS